MTEEKQIEEMATCKDCAHYEPCFDYGNILDPAHGGVKCDSFKSSADVVEVVRCKDCKYWGGSTFGYVCEAWSGMDLKNHTRPNGFCNYGERKEQK